MIICDEALRTLGPDDKAKSQDIDLLCRNKDKSPFDEFKSQYPFRYLISVNIWKGRRLLHLEEYVLYY